MIDRVRKLREAHLDLLHTKYREVKDLTVLDDEKVREESIVVRKAMALALLLDKTPAVIMDSELIVGLRTIYGPMGEGQNVFGRFSWELPVKPATEHILRYCPNYLTEEEVEEAQKAGIREGDVTGHVPYGVQRILRLGFGGIREEALQKMGEFEASPKEDSEKVDFLKAVVIVLDAASRFAVRHTHEAERLARETSDPRRRRELKNIAEVCHWVSVNPPRTWHEALQLFWFACIVHKIENQACLPIGRFDQDLYRFYKRDVEEGGLTRREGLELLKCLWIKLNLEDDLTTDSCENVTLSGQDSDGNDVTNELTYLCLDASLDLKLTDPKINVRFHRNSPPELWRRCIEMVKAGMGGFPLFFNDEANIAGLTRVGIPIEDARLYSGDGCQEIIIPGKGDFYTTFSNVDLLGCLLHILDASVDYETFEEFIEKYEKEVSATVKSTIADSNLRDSGLGRFSPVPFLSATLEGCVENAKDKTEGGTIYNYTGVLGLAFTNTVNSLAVVKKLIYDDRLVPMATLRDALAKNWAGYERLRQMAVNRVPKFGNDDNYVDTLAVEVADHFIQEVLKYQNSRGGRFYPGIFTFHHVTRGKSIKASPDGRREGEAVATHISPAVGTDLSGPTAVVNSALKICRLKPPEGAALGVRFHPSAVQGEVGTKNFTSFIKTFMDQGGIEIQFNIVDSETLKDAQTHPEQYKDLIVRVWGFSAYFVTLTKDYQDDIIDRTEHGV